MNHYDSTQPYPRDLVGYGLSEYLDQVVDGQPNGRVAGY